MTAGRTGPPTPAAPPTTRSRNTR
ncbi:MAG: hypothetical protein QOI26_2431, partial [Pseudonocardiales bacterium]|nr:hypothetical protein [Pseudonocardiales bacterium]